MQTALVMIPGVVMVLSGFAHAIGGWQGVGGALRSAGAPPDLITGVAAGWFLGSMAIGTFGVLVIAGGLRLKGDRSGLLTVRVIGAAYLYGLAVFVATGYEPHFLMLFIVPGALLLAGAR